MMNKIKTARVHLTKFFFVLPLLAVLLLAFRNKINYQKEFVFTGIIYDEETSAPIAGIVLSETNSSLSAITDTNGYFRFKIPITADSVFTINYTIEWSKFSKSASRSVQLNVGKGKNYTDVVFAGLNKHLTGFYKGTYDILTTQHHQYAGTNPYQFIADPDYSFVHNQFNKFTHQRKIADSLDLAIAASKKPIWIAEGIPYAFIGHGAVFFDTEELKISPSVAVWVDGKVMSIDEANKLVNRFEVKAVGTSAAENSLKEYGINKNLILIYWKTRFHTPKYSSDTIPNPQPPAADERLTPPVISGTPPPAFSINKGSKFSDSVRSIAPSDLDKTNGINKVTATVVTKDERKGSYNRQNVTKNDRYIKKYTDIPVSARNVPPAVVRVAPGQKAMPYKMIAKAAQTDNGSDSAVQLNQIFDSREAPRYVIDGIQMPRNFGLNKLAANSVKEINILKDKSATDKFGGKSKSGVIEIKTKKEPLIIVDGIGMPVGYDLNSINVNDIEKMEILKESDVVNDKNFVGIY